MKIKNWLKKNYFNIICCIITLSFICCSIFVFSNSFIRIKETCVDFFTSLFFYTTRIFGIKTNVVPTINNYSIVPYTPFLNIATSWQEFRIGWSNYWQVWATSGNFINYCNYVFSLLFTLLKIFVIVILPLLLILYFVLRRYLKKQNNKYGIDTKPLKVFNKITSVTYLPAKYFILNFISFVKENRIYLKLWLVIWLFNFNLLTIVFEFVAYCLYFCVSFDLLSIYKQVYKLFCDISVPISFIPLPFWFVIFAWWFFNFRKKIGYAKLNHYEMRNRGFINERPIVVMMCGTMGKKKTTLLTDVALSLEVIFKDKIYEKILINDLKFPFFNWVNLENALKYAIDKHYIYNLATARKYINHLKACFYVARIDMPIYKSVKRHLKKHFNIAYDNLCFDYDFERYGLYYDDKLQVVDLWKVIESYSQLYFIYIIESSLIISNYSIRSDNVLQSVGNFPIWDTDFFMRDSRLIDAYSRHAHIIDFDALRLGKKVIENNVKKDCFDFGILGITEVGKERKNNLELQEQKKKDTSANQKNDGFNDELKMIRHSATVDNFPFVKVITDEQRPESWGADARDLCDIIHIKETSDTKITMPFFALTELFYWAVYDRFVNLYKKYRFNRADNTLFMHIVKKITCVLNNYYQGIYNTFGYSILKVQVENGTQDGKFSDKKYYIMSKKIYSKRFSTDCFSDFFATKSLRSQIGINDLEEYKTEKATFEELKKQNSYFINDLINKEKENQ